MIAVRRLSDLIALLFAPLFAPLFALVIALAFAGGAFAQEQPNWAAAPGTPLSAWALQPTQADPRDPPRSVRVARGQSLYDIATLYQIPVLALIEANGLEPPYAVGPGAVLRLPAPNVHVVGDGERFEDIARAYNIDLHSLATLNRMRPPYAVAPGDRIVLPAGARSVDEAYASSAPPSGDTGPGGQADAAQTDAAQADALKVGSPQAGPIQAGAIQAGAVAPAAVQAGARFSWPIRGPIVARYGVQANGARLDGVEIAGRAGDPIAVAADGDVVYAGSDLAAYGTLVLVRHADNYVTAYGFARRALVREGQHVRAGQAIAELGARPDGRARLLFQVRQGAHAVDPSPLLGLAPD